MTQRIKYRWSRMGLGLMIAAPDENAKLYVGGACGRWNWWVRRDKKSVFGTSPSKMIAMQAAEFSFSQARP